MLVLSRTKEEVVVICDEHLNEIVRITIVDVRGDKVRQGFDADKRYKIHRLEVFEAIMREKKSGSESSQDSNH